MNQDVLISTIHNEDNVVEVYVNTKQHIVSELVFPVKGDAVVCQTDLSSYIDKGLGYKGVSERIVDFMEVRFGSLF